MLLSQKQINELSIGTPLAAELMAEKGSRKFIHVYSYIKDIEGRHKSIKNRKCNDDTLLCYGVTVYSVLSDIIENDWDIGENIVYHHKISDIKEILELESQIKKYLGDLSLLLPSWYCDDVL